MAFLIIAVIAFCLFYGFLFRLVAVGDFPFAIKRTKETTKETIEEVKSMEEIEKIKNIARRYVCDVYPDGTIPQNKLRLNTSNSVGERVLQIHESILIDFYNWLCRHEGYASQAEPMLILVSRDIITAKDFICNCSKCHKVYNEKKIEA